MSYVPVYSQTEVYTLTPVEHYYYGMCYFTTLTAASSTSTRGFGAGEHYLWQPTTDNHDFKSCELTTTYEHKTHTEYSID